MAQRRQHLYQPDQSFVISASCATILTGMRISMGIAWLGSWPLKCWSAALHGYFVGTNGTTCRSPT
jgi:hypothetical protein